MDVQRACFVGVSAVVVLLMACGPGTVGGTGPDPVSETGTSGSTTADGATGVTTGTGTGTGSGGMGAGGMGAGGMGTVASSSASSAASSGAGAAPPTELDLHLATLFDNPSGIADWAVTTKITEIDFQPDGKDGVR